VPKESFTKEAVLDAAWGIARESGFDSVSVRTVAAVLHSSPGPIYRHFGTMQQLTDALLQRAQQVLIGLMQEPYSEFPFLNMGVGFIRFARDEAKLFQTTLLTPRYAREFVCSTNAICLSLMAQMEPFAQLTDAYRTKILDAMSIISYGLAVQIFLGILPKPDDEEIIQRLNAIGTGALEHYQRQMQNGAHES
jgi:AcrR family transcriptional regulator